MRRPRRHRCRGTHGHVGGIGQNLGVCDDVLGGAIGATDGANALCTGDGTGRHGLGVEGLRIDEKDGTVTGPHAILGSLFLHSETRPHGRPHSINIFWAWPTKTDSSPHIDSKHTTPLWLSRAAMPAGTSTLMRADRGALPAHGFTAGLDLTATSARRRQMILAWVDLVAVQAPLRVWRWRHKLRQWLAWPLRLGR
jgi:hypothetical protein